MLSDYMLAVHTEKKIGLCHTCSGGGMEYEEVCSSYHRGEYEYIYKKCHSCNGYGLIETIKRTVVAAPKLYVTSPQIGYLPYNPKEHATYKE